MGENFISQAEPDDIEETLIRSKFVFTSTAYASGYKAYLQGLTSEQKEARFYSLRSKRSKKHWWVGYLDARTHEKFPHLFLVKRRISQGFAKDKLLG